MKELSIEEKQIKKNASTYKLITRKISEISEGKEEETQYSTQKDFIRNIKESNNFDENTNYYSPEHNSSKNLIGFSGVKTNLNEKKSSMMITYSSISHSNREVLKTIKHSSSMSTLKNDFGQQPNQRRKSNNSAKPSIRSKTCIVF